MSYREEIARILTPYFRHWKQMDEKRKVIELILALFPPELLELLNQTRDICPEVKCKDGIIHIYGFGFHHTETCPTCNGEGRVGEPHWDRLGVLTKALKGELENTKPEFQDTIAYLLNFASNMGAYGDPFGKLAVISPEDGKVLITEDTQR